MKKTFKKFWATQGCQETPLNIRVLLIFRGVGSRVKKLLLPETLEKGHNPNRLLPCERNENEAFT